MSSSTATPSIQATKPELVLAKDAPTAKRERTNEPTSQRQQSSKHLHPKQIMKRIHSCGNNYKAALDIFYDTQPFLSPDSNPSPDDSNYQGPFDAKPICTIINLLTKNKQYSSALNLLAQTVHQHESNIVPTYYLLAVYKSIIGMLATQQQKEKESQNLHRQMLQYLYHDIPRDINLHTTTNNEDQKTTRMVKPPPMDVYHVVISALGKCRQMDAILHLLDKMESNNLIEIPMESAANTSVSMQMRTEKKLQYKLPSPDRMAYLTALTGSTRCKSFAYAMEIMNRIKHQGMEPDKVAYNHLLSSLANTKSEGRYEMAKEIWQEMEELGIGEGKVPFCSDATYKTLIRIFSKENQWDDVSAVREKMNKLLNGSNEKGQQQDGSAAGRVLGVPLASVKKHDGAGNPNESDKTPLTLGYIKDLEKLERVNNSKKPWYKLGSVRCSTAEGEQVVFGIQTHRNPILNGVSLVFYTVAGEKLGFILIRNQLEVTEIQSKAKVPRSNSDATYVETDGNEELNEKQRRIESILSSSIMGMFVSEDHRGKGLANIFMGIWLQICLNSNAFPCSEKINKPLLSLVLSKFGFVPITEGAVQVEVSPIANAQDIWDNESLTELAWKPMFALYSSSPINFGERELRIQKMIVTRSPPNPRGKVASVKTAFEHPLTQKARKGQDYSTEFKDLSSLIEKIWKNSRKDILLDVKSENEETIEEGGIKFYVDNKSLQRVIFGYLF